MIIALLSIYIGWLLGLALTTVCLIFCGSGWGPLSHIYIRLVKLLQNFYPNCYPPADALWPAIIKRCDMSSLKKHCNDSLSSFKFSEAPMTSAFDVCSNAIKAGFEAVVQDQISVAFDSAPSYYSTLLERPGRLPFPDASCQISLKYIIGYLMALVIRYSILLPIRLCLIIVSFIFSISAVIADQFMNMTNEQRIHIGVVYCRLFCAGIGLVAKYHNREHRPKQPGIAVANHLSPNDVQVIYANLDPSDGCGFTITGQRHEGIIWVLETIVEKFIPTLWLERSDINDRERFMDKVLREAKNGGPVLLFPEGYCTNNTRVLRFRRAVFEDDITIYPIAIRQDARFGDSFWSEDQFWRYMLRILTSWAIVYDVTYLEAQQKQPGESSQDFAQRVQKVIAHAANVECISLDGRLWYVKSEQKRLKTLQMKNLAKRFEEFLLKEQKTIHNKTFATRTSKPLNGIKTSLLSTTPVESI